MQADAPAEGGETALAGAASVSGVQKAQAAPAVHPQAEPQRRRSGARGKTEVGQHADLGAEAAAAACRAGGLSQPESQATPAVHGLPAAAAAPAQGGVRPTATAARDPLAGFRDQA